MQGSKRAKELFIILNFKEGDRGEDSEAFIIDALAHEQIYYWAYCMHDKDVYNQHDMNIRYYGVQRCWADGVVGMEKYASMQEYLDEQMKQPPFIGDKKEARWYVFLIADKRVRAEDISDWFGMPDVSYVRILREPSSIKDAMQQLTREDTTSVAMEGYRYPDEEVRANFNFRVYMEGIKVNKKFEKWKNIWIPAPMREISMKNI